MALKHAGGWATVDSSYKILKGQEFTPLCKSWTATLLSFYKQGVHGLSMAEWTQHVLWQSASTRWFISARNQCQNEAFFCLHPYHHSRLHQTEIKALSFCYTPLKVPKWRRLLISPSSGKATDPSWSKLEKNEERGWQGTYKTPETCAGFGREIRVLIEGALRPER